MKLPQCDREQAVLDALRSGRWASAWGEELRQHAEVCPVCAEVALVTQLFQREADLARTELAQPGAGLPSAGLVWWKAQRAARRAAEQRAAEPIMMFERAAYALAALTSLGFGAWQWPCIAGWLRSVNAPTPSLSFSAMPESSFPSGWLHQLAQAWTSQPPAYLLAVCAAFFTLMVFAAYAVWRED